METRSRDGCDSLTARVVRTPAMPECRQSFNLGARYPPLPDEMAEQLESLEGLLNQTWNVLGVSTLFGFKPDSELQLKLYAKTLREEVAGILPHEDVTYDAEFSIMESIKSRPEPADPPSIKVEIISKATDKDQIGKTIYTGIFLSWRTVLTDVICENSMKLPLLLCRGTKSAMNAVHTIIGHMFDCMVVSLPATEDELMWLMPIILHPTTDQRASEKGEVRLEYRVPGLPASDAIIIKFELTALVKMWKAVIDYDEDEPESDMNIIPEQVAKFHQVIKKQMLVVGGLQLGLCILNKISLPSFTMTDNRMKATTTDAMNRFLLFFNDRALTVLHTLDYDSTQMITSETTASH